MVVADVVQPGPALSGADALTAYRETGPDEPPDLRGPAPVAGTAGPPGRDHRRGPARTPAGGPAVAIAPGAAVLIVVLIVGMIVAMVATGMRLISPQTLFFPSSSCWRPPRSTAAPTTSCARKGRRRTRRLPALPVGGPRQHPRPGRRSARRAAVVASRSGRTVGFAGTRRQWERDPHDADFLVVRAGRHSDVPLLTTVRVKDAADEVDLEPVSHGAVARHARHPAHGP